MCFGIDWIMHLLIWLVVIGAVVAIVRLLLPYVLQQFGVGGTLVMSILNIIMWAAVLIAIIFFAFELLSCLAGSSLGLPSRR